MITFDAQLANELGIVANPSLTLVMTLRKDEFDFYRPEFIIHQNSKNWDATTD